MQDSNPTTQSPHHRSEPRECLRTSVWVSQHPWVRSVVIYREGTHEREQEMSDCKAVREVATDAQVDSRERRIF